MFLQGIYKLVTGELSMFVLTNMLRISNNRNFPDGNKTHPKPDYEPSEQSEHTLCQWRVSTARLLCSPPNKPVVLQRRMHLEHRHVLKVVSARSRKARCYKSQVCLGS